MLNGFGRIEYDGNVIDLQRPWTSFQPRKPINAATSQAQSGIEHIGKFFSQYFIEARLSLEQPQITQQLKRLFEYAEGGSTFTLIRDRNLGTYINFEGGINPTAAPRGLKTNDDVDGTFTRTNAADSAWYLDEGTGLMTLRDGADVPRFPAGKYGAGIQMDGAAVNLITNRISNAAWTASNLTKVTTTETLDPAGNNSNVDILTATAASGNAFFDTTTAIGNIATHGIWLKSSIGTVAAQLSIEGTTGSSGLVIENINVTPIWQRFAVTQDTTAYTGFLRVRVLIENNTEIMYSWFTPQLFDSAEFDLGTVGPLSTSSITRNAGLLTFPSANIINRDKGSVLIRFKPRWGPSNLGTNFCLFHSGADRTNRHLSIVELSNNTLEISLYHLNGTTNTQIVPSTASIIQDSFNDLMVTYDGTVSNGINAYLAGALMTGGASSNDPFSVSEVDTNFAIGSFNDGVNPAFSTIDEILITKNVLSANEIAGISNLGIGLGVPRNRWTVRLADPTWNPRWLHSDVYDIPLLFKEVLT